MDNQFNELTYSGKMPTDSVDTIRVRFIVNHIPDDGRRVLDLGCWDGSYAARYAKTSNHVTGIESSETACREAVAKGIDARQGLFPESDPFSGEVFDTIVAGEIIEHVFDTDGFLRAVRDKLRDGGTLILTTPNAVSLPRRLLSLVGINPYLENRIIPGVSVGHIRYFTFRDMRDILEDNGFVIRDMASDLVNLDGSGNHYTTLLPRLRKELGRTILVCAQKISSSSSSTPSSYSSSSTTGE